MRAAPFEKLRHFFACGKQARAPPIAAAESRSST
jgi:hypothetical protein